jgi:hypothetical protein
MAIKVYRGKTKILHLPVTTSTALSADSLVMFTSGLLVAYTPAVAANLMVGVLVKAITASDTDYATSRLVAVRVPVEKCVEWEADFTATLLTTDIGRLCDTTDASTMSRATTSIGNFRITEFVSTTKGRGILNITG